MVVISHFKFYPALFSLKWLICIPNISAVRGNVVFESIHDFYRTAIEKYIFSVGKLFFSSWALSEALFDAFLLVFDLLWLLSVNSKKVLRFHLCFDKYQNTYIVGDEF